MQIFFLAPVYHLCANLAAALQDSGDYSFTLGSATALDAASLDFAVHVASLAASEGFIYFHSGIFGASTDRGFVLVAGHFPETRQSVSLFWQPPNS